MEPRSQESAERLGAIYASGRPPTMPRPPPGIFQERLNPTRTYSSASVASYSDLDDTSQRVSDQQKSQHRSRRRPARESDHKHKRTRSGCLTCRQRRVKCDEVRPVCDRCRKGQRECLFPPAKPGGGSNKAKATTTTVVSSPSGDDSEVEDTEMLSDTFEEDINVPIVEGESGSTSGSRKRPAEAQRLLKVSRSSQAGKLTENRPQRQSSIAQPSLLSLQDQDHSDSRHSHRWAELPKDVQTLLRYHRENLSYHHYGFKSDATDFLKTTFINIALQDDNQALFYAIVAFAAYHHAIARGDSRILNFLEYYNRSIGSLQQSLKSSKAGVPTLLAILQLATVEEFLGDWLNLLSHQRAAFRILIDLYTPETAMQDESSRNIIQWYIRFDLFAGMMSGGATSLGREWFAANHHYHEMQVKETGEDRAAMFDYYFATSRLLATDTALLLAAKANKTVNDEDFVSQTTRLSAQFEEFGARLESAFKEGATYVESFPKAPPPSDRDITDYRDPHFLYAGDLFTMNFVLMDFFAAQLMFIYQLAAINQQHDPRATAIALKKCKLFEAIQYCDEGPPGAVLGAQASLGIAALFLPKDEKHISWCRRKLASIEQLGYIYPPVLRARCSEVWSVDVNNWWLPNEQDYPEVIRALRSFIKHRASVPNDSMAAHVSNMSGIFSALQVDEQDYALTDTESRSPDVSRMPSMGSGSDPAWPG